MIAVDAVVVTAMADESAPFMARADVVGDPTQMGHAVHRLLTVGGRQVLLVECGIGLVEDTLTDITTATEVPAANEVQCGWGANHTLEGAQDAARTFLGARDEWEHVTA